MARHLQSPSLAWVKPGRQKDANAQKQLPSLWHLPEQRKSARMYLYTIHIVKLQIFPTLG